MKLSCLPVSFFPDIIGNTHRCGRPHEPFLHAHDAIAG